jgi:hypothetical protein
MRRLLSLLVLCVLAVPLAARAEGDLVLNGRVGVAKPGGSIQKDADLGDVVEWAFPLQVDFGFRVTPKVAITAYGRYAPTTLASDVKNACDAVNASCKATDIGLGVQAEYRFSDHMRGPWLGAFFGYELFKYESGVAAMKAKSTLKGFEGGLQGGVDFEWAALNLGPYAALNLGQLSKYETDGGGSTVSGDISNKTMHTWITVGLRVGFAF